MDSEGAAELWRRHWTKVAIALALLELVLFLYPPTIERVIPNYYIHMEVWIPMGIAAHAYLVWRAWTRRPPRPPRVGGSSKS